MMWREVGWSGVTGATESPSPLTSLYFLSFDLAFLPWGWSQGS
jgi:hypothetical protein